MYQVITLVLAAILCHSGCAQAKEKVFGIGLSRTGTKSLNASLKILGYNAVHFPDDETYKDMVHATMPFRILKNVDAITDVTTIPYFIQLHQIYPNAKFILTVRDKEAWLDGCSTFFQKHPPKFKLKNFIRSAVYGCLYFNRERFSHVYDEHLRKVLSYFEDYPDSLLILPICDGVGWDPLCEFLGEPTPSVPFPRIK